MDAPTEEYEIFKGLGKFHKPKHYLQKWVYVVVSCVEMKNFNLANEDAEEILFMMIEELYAN